MPADATSFVRDTSKAAETSAQPVPAPAARPQSMATHEAARHHPARTIRWINTEVEELAALVVITAKRIVLQEDTA
jgi:hypothetical protein